jgi:hypothetical protein
MKIKITKQEVVEGDISDHDAAKFVEKYIFAKLLKIKYYDSYGTHYYLDKDKKKIILSVEVGGGSHKWDEEEEVRDATEEDIAIFKTLEVLRKQK